MFVRRRVVVATVAMALAVSACGTSSDGATAETSPAPPATETASTAEALTPTPTDADATDSDSLTPTPAEAADEPADIADEPADIAEEPADPPATEAPVQTEVAVGDTAPNPDADAVEPPPASEPASATPSPAEVGGRAFAQDLATASDIATNPLPDLLVDDIRRGTKVNLRNVFPADRPVLVWMWAPH